MDPNSIGTVIRELREKKGMTQARLAEKLNVSDKTVSKWETAKGFPDITLLEPIAAVFGISLTELLSGAAVKNMNVSANMHRSKFYVCPICGNIIHSMGEAVLTCHGVKLTPCEPEQPDERHKVSIQRVEDEFYVEIDHEMSKSHYISFIASVSPDRLQMVKLYPEGSAAARLKISGFDRIYYYCNRDGLFYTDIKRGKKGTVDDK